MFRPKHVELFAGNKILYKKSVILLEHLKKMIHDARTDEHKNTLEQLRCTKQTEQRERLLSYCRD
jgi:hypothetical protein